MDPAKKSFHDRLARLEKNAPPREVMFDFTKSNEPIRATPAPKAPRDRPDINMPLVIACGLGLTASVMVGLFADTIFAGTQTVKSAAMAALDKNDIYLNYDPETLSAPSASVALDKSGRPLNLDRQRSVFENAPAPPTGFIAALQKRQSDHFVENVDLDNFTVEGMERKQRALQQVSDKLDRLVGLPTN